MSFFKKIFVLRSVSFLGALICGWSLWLFSRSYSGKVEPWDSDGSGYYILLFFAGLLVFFSSSKTAIYFGVFLGQLLYILTVLGTSKHILTGMVFLALFSCLSVLGAAFFQMIGRIIAKKGPMTSDAKSKEN